MKKNVLSLSIATMIGSLALSGAASAGVAYMAGTVAATVAGANATALPPSSATVLEVNPSGIGHILLVPYYSVQEGNGTLLSIVNTDTTNGKAVKVRFRGASNSDDVFDFTLLMSPGDVWTANVSKDAASGKAQLFTPDNSCTLPNSAALNSAKFLTARVYGADEAARALETLEGYVEIFNMADIPPKVPANAAGEILQNGTVATDNPLFTAIKHATSGDNAGKSPCSSATTPAAVAKLMVDPVMNNIVLSGGGASTTGVSGITGATAAEDDRTALLRHGLWAPTTGLTGSWTILNIFGASVAWSGNMTAIEARTAAAGAAAPGRVVFSPQQQVAVPAATVNKLTADPLLRNLGANTGGPGKGIISAMQYDLPDMSTPYLTGGDFGTTDGASELVREYAPIAQAEALTKSLAVKRVINEYITNPKISAATEWVFSMPTRRYAVGVDYTSTATMENPVFNGTSQGLPATGNERRPSDFFTSTNTKMGADGAPKYQACVEPGGDLFVYNQEEAKKDSGGFVISPGVAGKSVNFCGEVSVLGFSTTQALKAKIATKDIDTGGFTSGWMDINTRGLEVANSNPKTYRGLPIIGSAFVKMTGPIAAGKSTNFSITAPHRFTK